VRTILKLLIVAAILNATARTAMAAWRYYQFKDAAQQTLVFGGDATAEELHALILRRAVDLEVPIEAEAIEVTRDGPRMQATAAYTDSIELFPRYSYPFDFSFSVDAMAISPLGRGRPGRR
jgi:hypothetical protein